MTHLTAVGHVVVQRRVWHRPASGGHGAPPPQAAGGIGGLPGLEAAGGIGGLPAVDGRGTDPNNPADDLACICLYDANGNVGQVLTITSVNGENYGIIPAAKYEYDPYGNRINTPAQGEYKQPFRFSTKQWDDETGLGYWGYRYHSPSVGRWLSRDPNGELGAANLYAALRNAPLNWIDPDGAEEVLAQPPASAPTGPPVSQASGPETRRPFQKGTFDVRWGPMKERSARDPKGGGFKGVGSSLLVRYTLTDDEAVCCLGPRLVQVVETGSDVAYWFDDNRRPHIDSTGRTYPFYDHQEERGSKTRRWVQLDDEPGLEVDPKRIRSFSQSFEACVVCTAGSCKGTLIGCVTYGHYWNTATQAMVRWGDGLGIGPGAPSQTFMDLLSGKGYRYGSCTCRR